MVKAKGKLNQGIVSESSASWFEQEEHECDEENSVVPSAVASDGTCSSATPHQEASIISNPPVKRAAPPRWRAIAPKPSDNFVTQSISRVPGGPSIAATSIEAVEGRSKCSNAYVLPDRLAKALSDLESIGRRLASEDPKEKVVLDLVSSISWVLESFENLSAVEGYSGDTQQEETWLVELQHAVREGERLLLPSPEGTLSTAKRPVWKSSSQSSIVSEAKRSRSHSMHVVSTLGSRSASEDALNEGGRGSEDSWQVRHEQPTQAKVLACLTSLLTLSRKNRGEQACAWLEQIDDDFQREVERMCCDSCMA